MYKRQILQSLGFLYHIDEPSRDEPFIVPLKGGDFVTVLPYGTRHLAIALGIALVPPLLAALRKVVAG